MSDTTQKKPAAFDFIIVGAGSAGCVLANRLSSDGKHSVLLLETGGSDRHINFKIPALVAKLLSDARCTWQYMTQPQEQLNGKPQKWVQGKVLGGSSSINGCLFVRGDPSEYDAWAQNGCDGWSYSELLPYFKKLESYPKGNGDVRGKTGPIACTQLERTDALSDAFLQACVDQGYPRSSDCNDGGTGYDGVFYSQYSTRKGFRSSTSVEYLRPALSRPNLTVLTHAQVQRVTFDGTRATGVDLLHEGRPEHYDCAREVIIAAGALHSPAVLERSGIGRRDILEAAQITPLVESPEVGENLRDHASSRLTYRCSQPITINDLLRSPWMKMKEGMKFLAFRKGILSICSSTVQLNCRNSPASTRADTLIRLQPLSGLDRYARTPEAGMDPYPGFTVSVGALYPQSLGYTHIISSDVNTPPRMTPNYLSHEEDKMIYMNGLRIARSIVAQSALKDLVVEETRPGPAISSDAQLIQHILSGLQTSWHIVGTCRMGSDDKSVVDTRLRVRGAQKLRVIDASIFPTMPASNTNIPTIMLAEKAADMIFEDMRSTT